MNKILFLISLGLILFLSNQIYSQNYQAFNSGRNSYFEDANHYVKSVRIDSVHFDTDSVLFPMGNIRPNDFPCYSSFGASWLGEKIIVKSNGQNLVFNKNNDTVFIKTNALLNEVWVAFQIPGEMIITAQVSEVDTLSFLGLNDSVKYISFQVYNQGMIPINHMLNTCEIILSKNYGMIKTLNFYHFPDIEVCDFDCQYLKEFYIAGMSNPMAGISNFTSLDIYNFQPGDELHISEGFSAAFSWNHFTRNEIYRYLQRYDYGDSIFYNVELTSAAWDYSEAETTYSFYVDTIIEKYYLNSFLSCLPDEAFSDGWMMSAPMMVTEPHLAKVDNSAYGFVFDGENCWSSLMCDGLLPYKYYYYGLGGPYFSETSVDYGSESRTLLYYQIGSETWGIPLLLSGLNSEVNEPKVAIYPNPANNRITVDIESVESNGSIEIFNIIGVKLINEKLISGQTSVDLNRIPSGVYFYQIKSGNEVLKNGKFVKE